MSNIPKLSLIDELRLRKKQLQIAIDSLTDIKDDLDYIIRIDNMDLDNAEDFKSRIKKVLSTIEGMEQWKSTS